MDNILIVGAGPSGLTVALALLKHGIRPRIIDKLNSPLSTSNALAIHARSLNILRDLNVIDDFLAQGLPIRTLALHADKRPLAKVSFESLDTAYPFALSISQPKTESILTSHLRAHGIVIERGVALKQVVSEAQGVVAILQKENILEEMQCDWLLSCDGAHSTIREELNLPFIGKELPQYFAMADVKLDWDKSQHELQVFLTKHGPFAVVPIDQDTYRIITEITHDKAYAAKKDLTFTEFEALCGHHCPVKINLTDPQWISTFHIHRRLLQNFRHQRILFAGDAAHIHSPEGGQGMNTGIQDAYNLAWKLAYVVKQQADEAILDSYHEERFAIAKQVLKGTSWITTLATSPNRFLQAIRNRAITLAQRFPSNRHKVAGLLSELAICYPPGSLVKNSGKLLPHCHITTDQTLESILDYTHFHILCFTGELFGQPPYNAFLEIANWIEHNYKAQIKVVLITTKIAPFKHFLGEILFDETKNIHHAFNMRKPGLAVVRPDKYIAYQSHQLTLTKLKDYLHFLI